MVGIVVVSHSPDLADAAVSLALQMVHGPAPALRLRLALRMIDSAPMRRASRMQLRPPTVVRVW
jgi:hypothetical protein